LIWIKARAGRSPTGATPAGHKAREARLFTIEHDFDATVITLVDEGAPELEEDVIIHSYEDGVTIEQVDPTTDLVQTITMSMTQLRDLSAALNLPEGVYRLRRVEE